MKILDAAGIIMENGFADWERGLFRECVASARELRPDGQVRAFGVGGIERIHQTLARYRRTSIVPRVQAIEGSLEWNRLIYCNAMACSEWASS